MTRLLVDATIAPCSETWRDAVRCAEDVVDSIGTWRESFAPLCWLARGNGAPVLADHDGAPIGSVFQIIDHGGWHIAEVIIESDDEKLLERVRVGQAVSIDAYSTDIDHDIDLRLRRHIVTRLNHLAILRDRDIPGYAGAKILAVRELPARTTAKGEVIATRGIIRREGIGQVIGVR